MGDLNDVTFWQSERLENRSLLWLVPLPSRSKVMRVSRAFSHPHTDAHHVFLQSISREIRNQTFLSFFFLSYPLNFDPIILIILICWQVNSLSLSTAPLSKNSTRMLSCWNGQLLRSKDWKIGERGEDEFSNTWIWTLKIFGRWLIVNKNGIKRILSSSFFLSWINDFQVFQSSSFLFPSSSSYSLWNPPPLHLTPSPFCFLCSFLSTAFSFYSLLSLSLCSFSHDWNQLFFLEVNPIYSLITFVGRKRRAV